MTISVRLPRECSGQEILDAFRNAATFQEKPTIKWFAENFTSRDGEVTSDATFIAAIGARATSKSLQKRGRIAQRLFGAKPERWESWPLFAEYGKPEMYYGTQVTLVPLFPHKKYTSVELRVHHVYDCDTMATEYYVAKDPDHEGFSGVRYAYDKIVRDLIQNLSH